MKRRILFLTAIIFSGSTVFAQDTTGSTKPQIIIPLGKKPAKKSAESYRIDTLASYNNTMREPFPRKKTSKNKTKKIKAAKPVTLPPAF
jgi:hypothetical protein